jgi:hypothetical protein
LDLEDISGHLTSTHSGSLPHDHKLSTDTKVPIAQTV